MAGGGKTFGELGVASAGRHAFLCIGPDCCTTDCGTSAWDVLKKELKESGAPVLRTKAACLRLCHGGPWMVVYPEGIWYGGVDAERCRRIVQEHLVGGKVIEEWVAQRAPLGG